MKYIIQYINGAIFEMCAWSSLKNGNRFREKVSGRKCSVFFKTTEVPLFHRNSLWEIHVPTAQQQLSGLLLSVVPSFLPGIFLRKKKSCWPETLWNTFILFIPIPPPLFLASCPFLWAPFSILLFYRFFVFSSRTATAFYRASQIYGPYCRS